LGVEALRQGNHEVVEMSYQKTKEFERLSFLYLLTGNTEKLRKMLKIADMRGDVMSRFHNALFLGDAEERMRVLEATGQTSLAFLAAASHGLDEDAERLQALLEGSKTPLPAVNRNGTLLQPPTAILRGENWPLLAVGKSALSDMQNGNLASGGGGGGGVSSVAAAAGDEEFQDATEGANQWGDEDDLFDDEEGGSEGKKSAGKVDKSEAGDKGGGGGNGGWEDDELDLSDEETPVVAKGGGKAAASSGEGFYTAPQGGTSPTVTWCAESTHAADHMAAGSAESALQLLNRQIAAVNVLPMRANALSLFLGSSGYLPGLPLAPANRSYLMRDTATAASGKSSSVAKLMPCLTLKATPLLELLKNAYRAFTSAQFAECKTALIEILSSIPLVSATSRTETNDLKELVDVSREYITAVRVKAMIGEVGEADAARALELAAYFTHCNLQPSHLMLALKTAMASAFKCKNYINAASFARRLLELPDMSSERNAESRSKAQKVLQKSEQQGRNELVIAYDEMNPFVLDCFAFKPIYRGSPSIKCSYCASHYAPDYKGKLCVTCNMCIVGIETIGLCTTTNATSKR